MLVVVPVFIRVDSSLGLGFFVILLGIWSVGMCFLDGWSLGSVFLMAGDFNESYLGLEFWVDSCSVCYLLRGVWLGMEASSSYFGHLLGIG